MLPISEVFVGLGAKNPCTLGEKGKGRHGSLNRNLPSEIVAAYQKADCWVRPVPDVICIQQTAK